MYDGFREFSKRSGMDELLTDASGPPAPPVLKSFRSGMP
jgi:hypothetical protein